ncbi:MAG: M20/M25/M40 family metallo-hydrolase [Gemmatimonadaceae bacterium]|jgi:acetylornithine deacetylase/succinyl-diaminopimelate desuccinylase-like protein|nr:M20/M25/M40 family metallo-hydrolase [Gemmatimonadaceae bacterium]
MRIPRIHARRARLALAVLLWPLATAHAQPPAPTDPTAALLAELIRINTSNPPGNEQAIADFLAPRFRAAGFEVDIIATPQAGKAHFIARLRGDGSKRPLLLAAHADVVGVEREKWSVDPFAGIIKDGYVYGRGAIDFKGGMAVFVQAVLQLAERKVPLARDIIFLAEADEEGGQYNTSVLAREHWPKIDAEFALNEGGWIVMGDDGRVQYASISTADKTTHSILLSTRGTSTHSSMPLPDNAIFRLTRAMARLADHETAVELVPGTRRFFETLAKTSTGATSQAFRDLVSDDPARVARADSAISRDPLLHAIMRNTIAPVIMNAGFRANVIPGSAEATVNVRLLPGVDPERIAQEIRTVVRDSLVTVKVGAGVPRTLASASSAEDTPLYQSLERQLRQQYPTALVTPYVFQAFTDAGAWRARGVPVYGIYPYAITGEDLRRMHGNDERVRVQSLTDGTAMLYRVLVDVAGRR